mmetsp:Transcript_18428/g.29987  ORF Transcript_18428/g.29987 Transcript_18428/m.29987 type:complete len:274 (+) Transcript_18428:134-955(+)|eukprot:CAMPEP_0203780186 /NCGR_PEP_ID=MMETSP0099_2-20121227/9265_1 /ASSEMBLY_ACC=CAM_ASM_000209 /TAXON_ID=96639 /ORGANISM=" , Strain NY0313808BC1" /LENGTH=273 /DNA_ID=CAMNT_0050680483 /DNA_START=78 /DNA_END=899 /DNA_ORIENTATION=-
MNAARGAGKLVGPIVERAGIALERMGCATGFKPTVQAYIAKRPWAEESQGRPGVMSLVAEVDKFVAPTATVPGDLTIGNKSGVWYGAVVQGPVTIGSNTSLLEFSHVEGSTSSPTKIGNQVTISPRAQISAGVVIGDRSVISAGAHVDTGVVVESDAMVAAGAKVPSGTTVKSNELWAGNPAVLVRKLEPSELSELAEDAEYNSTLAIKHAQEAAKDIFTLHDDREAIKDRRYWINYIVQDRDQVIDNFVPVDVYRDEHPERQGLIFDKKDEK